MLTQTTKTVSNQDEAEEAQEHPVEFFEPREDSAIALQASVTLPLKNESLAE